MRNMVAIGGGTGTSMVLKALQMLPDVNPMAIVAVSDSGGSTGRLRDEFGFPAVGDLRQSLAALANEDSAAWIRKLLLYRFSSSGSLSGHNLGNLILTALQDMTGGTGKALETAKTLFALHGKVLPVTEQAVNLHVLYASGKDVAGEESLDDPLSGNEPIKDVYFVPQPEVYPPVIDALQTADTVIIGPGDYYASLLAVLNVPGVYTALRETSAKLVFVLNLMSRYTQTDGWTAQRYVDDLHRRIHRLPDAVILNNAPIPKHISQFYAAAKEYSIQDDLGTEVPCIRADLLADVAYSQQHQDAVQRSVLRHNPQKLAKILSTLG